MPLKLDLLSTAQQRGYSKHGEMLSAYHLAQLIEECAPGIQTSVSDDWVALKQVIFESLFTDSIMVLVAYDCDASHFPSNKKGNSPHWGLLSGLVFTFEKALQPKFQLKKSTHKPLWYSKTDDTYLRAEQLRTQADVWKEKLKELADQEEWYVIGQQTKSKQPSVWHLQSLEESSKQMTVTPARCVEEEMVVPKDYPQTLAGKYIVIQRPLV